MTATSTPAEQQPTLFHQPMPLEMRFVTTASIEPPETKGLVKAVSKFGMLQTVLLCQSSNPAYEYQIIAGSRRVNTAIKENILQIPAMITSGTSAQYAAARAIENSARRPNPVQEALAWREVLDSGVYADLKALAADLNVPLNLVKKRLRLAQLPARILQGINDGLISAATAAKMSTLDPNYLPLAFAAYDASVANDQHFTHDDLRAVQVRKGQQTKAAALGALSRLPAMQPLITLDPVMVLAEQVRQMCSARNVDPHALAQALSGTTLGGAVARPEPTPIATLPVSLPVLDHSTTPFPAEEQIPFDVLGNDLHLEDPEELPFGQPLTPGEAVPAAVQAGAEAFPLDMAADEAFPLTGPAGNEPDAYSTAPVEDEVDWSFEQTTASEPLHLQVQGTDDVSPASRTAEAGEPLGMPWDMPVAPAPAPRAPARGVASPAYDTSNRIASAPLTAPRAERAPRASLHHGDPR